MAATKRNTKGLKRGHSSKQAKKVGAVRHRKKAMSPKHMAFAQAYLRLRVIADAARELGLSQRQGYRMMQVPAVKEFIDKVEAKTEEIIVKDAAIDMVKLLAKADRMLDKVLDIDTPHKFSGFKDQLTAVALAYKRTNAFENPNKNANTPGSAAAAAINSTHVHVHTNQPVGVSATGEGVYEPRWIRENYGVNNPNADAIDAEYGGLDALSGGAVTGRTQAAEVEMETGDAGAVEGAE